MSNWIPTPAQLRVLDTLWNIHKFNSQQPATLPGRPLKVAADKLRKLGLVERIERGIFVEPGYRLTADGLTIAEQWIENR